MNEGDPFPSNPVTALATRHPGDCPMARLLDTLAGRWSFPILYTLCDHPHPLRFGVLRRKVGRVTQKELTRHLRRFEELGLVERTVFPEVPPRVEYTITAYGRTLQTPLRALAEWSLNHGDALFEAQARLLVRDDSATADHSSQVERNHVTVG